MTQHHANSIVWIFIAVSPVACGSNSNGSLPDIDSRIASGGAALVASGGTSIQAGTTGTSSSTGNIPGAGGSAVTSTGGSASGGAAAGGTTGTIASSTSGGNVATGGAATGGVTAGTGGAATGGKSSTGGAATGGKSSTGGAATGGKSSTGGASTGGTAAGGNPPTATLRVFYLRPTDVTFDQKYPDGIGQVMVEAQAFYKQQLGVTFKLNNPIVEVLVGEHVKNWYETTPNGGDKYWWSATNAQQEIARRLGLSIPDKRWMVVSEVSAEGDGAGGGASGGWVLLCGHDADGGAAYPSNKARWIGGMVHELGHAFGLPDATSTDGTCMSASFYGWPSCTFTQAQKDKMLNGNWGTGKFLF